MAAHVQRPSNRIDQHADGEGLFIRDGHLTIGTDRIPENSRTIAVYAPGQWTNATIVEAAKG